MGQTLSKPVTTKESAHGEDSRYYYGISSMQGWRVFMEDAHSVILDVKPDDNKKIAWFAVFDGHGGLIVRLVILILTFCKDLVLLILLGSISISS